MGCILGFAPHPPGGVKVPEPKIRHPKWDAPWTRDQLRLDMKPPSAMIG